MASSTDEERFSLESEVRGTWCNWVLKAWEEIDPSIIVKAFRRVLRFQCIGYDIVFEEETGNVSEEEDPFADMSIDEKIDYSDI